MDDEPRRLRWTAWSRVSFWVLIACAVGSPTIGGYLAPPADERGSEAFSPGATAPSSRPAGPATPSSADPAVPAPDGAPAADDRPALGRIVARAEEGRVRIWEAGHPDAPLLEGAGREPLVAPDGRRVVFKRSGEAGPSLLVARIAGDHAHPTVEPEAALRGVVDEGGLAWAPDGRRLAVTIATADAPQVWVLDLRAEGRVYRLSPDGGHDPIWLPSGRILWQRRVDEGVEVWIRDADAEGRAHRVQGPARQGEDRSGAAVA